MSTTDVTQPPGPASAGEPARRPARRAPVKRAGAAKKAPPAPRLLPALSPPTAVPEGKVRVYVAARAMSSNGRRYLRGEIVQEASEFPRIESWVRARWFDQVDLDPAEVAQRLAAQGQAPEQPVADEEPQAEQPEADEEPPAGEQP